MTASAEPAVQPDFPRATADCAATRDALARLWAERPDAFTQIFLLEGATHLDQDAAVPLLAASLVERDHDGYRAVVRIWPHHGRFYVSDLFTSDAKDRVYPVYVDQGAFFADHLACAAGDSVLDVGTGSGILAIEAAWSGATVIGIDISARATHFARFNAALNDVPNVMFVTCSLDDYQPVAPSDVVLCNPPFTAVPEPDAWYLHGSAGKDGHDVFRRLLSRLPLVVASDGCFQVLLNSLGTATTAQAVSLIENQFPAAGVEVHHLYAPPKRCVDVYATRFEASPAYRSWRAWLDARGFTHVYRMLITVDLANTGHFSESCNRGFHFPVIERFGAPPELATDASLLGGWDEMLLRYGSRTRVTTP
jgi:predicted RNA methylase